MLTAFFWHLVVFASAWLNTLGKEDTSCADASGFCFTASDTADLLFMAGSVLLVFSALLSLATAGWFARRVRSAVLAGTLGALIGMVAVVAISIALIFLNTTF